MITGQEIQENIELRKLLDLAIADLGKVHACTACVHSVRYSGIPCCDRKDLPSDGSCDFKWIADDFHRYEGAKTKRD